jgi:hypothetical protein
VWVDHGDVVTDDAVVPGPRLPGDESLATGPASGPLGSLSAGPLGRLPHPSGPAWDLAVGTVAILAEGAISAARAGSAMARPVVVLVLQPPLVAERYHPMRVVDALIRRGRRETQRGEQTIEHVMAVVVPQVVDEVIAQLDLTRIVKEHVDLNAIVADVDVDAIAARLDVDSVARHIDIDAIIARVDIVGIAQQVIDEIDLPEIIRGSTGSMASEAILDVRMQSIEADEALSRIVDRLFFRRKQRRTDAPGEPESLAGSVADEPDKHREEAT